MGWKTETGGGILGRPIYWGGIAWEDKFRGDLFLWYGRYYSRRHPSSRPDGRRSVVGSSSSPFFDQSRVISPAARGVDPIRVGHETAWIGGVELVRNDPQSALSDNTRHGGRGESLGEVHRSRGWFRNERNGESRNLARASGLAARAPLRWGEHQKLKLRWGEHQKLRPRSEGGTIKRSERPYYAEVRVKGHL